MDMEAKSKSVVLSFSASFILYPNPPLHFLRQNFLGQGIRIEYYLGQMKNQNLNKGGFEKRILAYPVPPIEYKLK